ncbi:WD40-repeat-containing domain protein [Mycena vulgaris]|nr:WD40-repeat-containing domain protein [Mycena vulgaris]
MKPDKSIKCSWECLSIAFSPNDEYLATGSIQGTIQIWDLRLNKLLGQHQPHRSGIHAIAFSPDGKKVAAASVAVHIWDLSAADITNSTRTLTGHSKRVNVVSFSPDGRWVVSGSDDHVAIIWNVETGERQHEDLSSVSEPVFAATFSADGTRVATGANSTLQLWDAVSGRCLSAYRPDSHTPIDRVWFNESQIISSYRRVVTGNHRHYVHNTETNERIHGQWDLKEDLTWIPALGGWVFNRNYDTEKKDFESRTGHPWNQFGESNDGRTVAIVGSELLIRIYSLGISSTS